MCGMWAPSHRPMRMLLRPSQPEGTRRSARRKGFQGQSARPIGFPGPSSRLLPAHMCHCALCRSPGAAAVKIFPLACLVNKERARLGTQTEVKRPGLGERRGGPGMRGVVSEKKVSIDTVGAALHMGGTASSRPSSCSRRRPVRKANCLAQRPSDGR